MLGFPDVSSMTNTRTLNEVFLKRPRLFLTHKRTTALDHVVIEKRQSEYHPCLMLPIAAVLGMF
jgi:hypothetical protein